MRNHLPRDSTSTTASTCLSATPIKAAIFRCSTGAPSPADVMTKGEKETGKRKRRFVQNKDELIQIADSISHEKEQGIKDKLDKTIQQRARADAANSAKKQRRSQRKLKLKETMADLAGRAREKKSRRKKKANSAPADTQELRTTSRKRVLFA
ncbi:hypothetical protein BOTBODRAFT_55756 [Botryobasidium botryosum FD-172 SS1]|uniref:Uncharacterized protein n=1 Tax=Botryobasidium botryosum (strain FD-172 SS1) TaxID=930990 RepID=A0A067MQ55_BOTB1|nr:hypothetical protein BOTBODRAFT_55756 [Botryobasidium botryosum FD-172 SS1]